jgi:hypothetical protein
LGPEQDPSVIDTDEDFAPLRTMICEGAAKML